MADAKLTGRARMTAAFQEETDKASGQRPAPAVVDLTADVPPEYADAWGRLLRDLRKSQVGSGASASKDLFDVVIATHSRVNWAVGKLSATAADQSTKSEAAQRAGTLVDGVDPKLLSLVTEVQIAQDGANPSSQCTLFANSRTYAELTKNQSALGAVGVNVMLPRIESPDDGDVQLAGPEVACVGTVEARPGEGIWLCDLNWTDAGRRGCVGYPLILPFVWFDPADRSILFVQSATLAKLGAMNGHPWPALVKLSPEQLSAGPSARERMMRSFRHDTAPLTVALSADAPSKGGLTGLARIAAAFARQNVKENGR
jgi:hypothetical protein